jgi:hypothetical protein
MNDGARDKLCELLAQQGPSLLTLGRTCEMLIAQSCVDCPEEAKALIQVEKQGIAKEIVNAPDEASREKTESWVKRLVDQGNLNDSEARWALGAWTAALKSLSPQKNQTVDGPAWSEANFEAAARTPEQRQQQAPAGARVGVLTGLLVGCFFCYAEALSGSHGIGQIWFALIGLPRGPRDWLAPFRNKRPSEKKSSDWWPWWIWATPDGEGCLIVLVSSWLW